jgi:NADH-quinone oxidoreductase subunit J
MILLVVYVGAVAVLFLFVVMMLDVDFAEMKSGALEYAPVGALVGIILAAELIIVLAGNAFHPAAAGSACPIPALSERSNTQALGDVLYTDYIFFFQIAGMVLLVAMIGAIVLTLGIANTSSGRDINQQVARTPETAIEVVKVKPARAFERGDVKE